MFYYRYRPATELAIKELIYDEMYFASEAECNDPYEGKIFARFEKDEGRWNRLINCALSTFPGISAFKYIEQKISKYFFDKSPLYIDDVLNEPLEEFLKIADNDIERIVYKNLLNQIKEYVTLYIPPEKYFVSFSKNCNNTLMWAHYASNHCGHCLIFRVSDQKIYQSPMWKRKSLNYTTPRSFSPKMSFGIDDSFTLRDITYIDEPEYVDAFLCFPAAVYGNTVAEKEVKKFREKFNNTYFQKHIAWKYEEETRILLSSGISWLAGQKLSATSHQRLFHYDSTQLVGIVLGAKMPTQQKSRIEEIVEEKVERWYTGQMCDKTISNFVIFEERLSTSDRETNIVPVKIFDGITFIDKHDKNFDQKYYSWKEGEAIHFYGTNKAEKVKII